MIKSMNISLTNQTNQSILQFKKYNFAKMNGTYFNILAFSLILQNSDAALQSYQEN